MIHVSVTSFQVTNTLLTDAAFLEQSGQNDGGSTGLHRTSYVFNQAWVALYESGNPDAKINTSMEGYRSNQALFNYKRASLTRALLGPVGSRVAFFPLHGKKQRLNDANVQIYFQFPLMFAFSINFLVLVVVFLSHCEFKQINHVLLFIVCSILCYLKKKTYQYIFRIFFLIWS